MKKTKTTIYIILILLLIFLVSVNLKPFFENYHLSGYSEKWNDVSKFREDVSEHGCTTSCVISTSIIIKDVEPENSLFVSIGVEKKYTEREITTIQEFVSHGGKAIIADDFGYGNCLAEKFGIMFYNKKLWSENYSKASTFTVATAVIDEETYSIMLNIPTGMRVLGNITAEIICSVAGYIDSDRGVPNALDLLDEKGVFPVILEIKYGMGSIVFISDPGIFINGMIDREDNRIFLSALIHHLLSNNGRVIFDESRHIKRNAYIIEMINNPEIVGIATVLLIAGAAILIHKTTGKKKWMHRFELKYRHRG